MLLSSKSLIIKTTHSLYCLLLEEEKWILIKVGSVVSPLEDNSQIETGKIIRGKGLELSSSGILLTNEESVVATTSAPKKIDVFKFETQNSIYAVAPILDAGKFILIKIAGKEDSGTPIYTTILGDCLQFKPDGAMEIYDGEEVVYYTTPIKRLF